MYNRFLKCLLISFIFILSWCPSSECVTIDSTSGNFIYTPEEHLVLIKNLKLMEERIDFLTSVKLELERFKKESIFKYEKMEEHYKNIITSLEKEHALLLSDHEYLKDREKKLISDLNKNTYGNIAIGIGSFVLGHQVGKH